MASEEPPSIRHTPLDTSKRPISAPPAGDAVTKTLVVNMSTEISAMSVAQATGKQSGSVHESNDPAVKLEPESGSSVPQNLPSIPSSELCSERANSLPKQEADTAAASTSDPEKKLDKITLDNIQKLADETDLIKLEAGVDEALAILDTLQAPLSDSKQIKQLEWLTTINKLTQQSKKTRTVVAVVGETGAGKTSLINALLNEDKLLVTSGWRACTAVICEISYNGNDDPQEAYRAEIEFVSQEDWDHDLQILFSELIEDDHLSSAKSDGKTEAGIAYAKIKAVYPDLTDNMIAQHTAKSLAQRESVAEVLGTTRRIACRNASDLCSAVQKYMDSKEKSTTMGPKKEKDMAFWPLIKVVRIFCQAEVLSTGLVLVDLPGVADSNPARAAVASKYMTECTAVWVAAPIKRAADNKVAKALMGKSSRLQMKLDGLFPNVTFICTSTDLIEFKEAIEAFDDDGQIRATYSREDVVQNTIMEKNDAMEHLKVQTGDLDLRINALERELQAWDDIQERHQKGHQVYPPQLPSKRKRPAGSRRTRASRRKVVDEVADDEEVPEAPPLTANDISAKLHDLNNQISLAEHDYEDMEKQCIALEQELINLGNEKIDAAVDGARLCVQRRNEIVKKSIRVDFASGIRELDEDEADQGDEEGLDASAAQSRDYDQVARSLPVFTISAKAFQQICRPKKRETQVAGFRTPLDTEIPQLVDHAMKLPEQGRIAARRTWLNGFRQLLGSLTIWCTAGDNDLGSTQMTAEEQTYEMQYLKNEMLNLRKSLDNAIMAQKKELENIMHNDIDLKSTAAIKYAAKEIPGLVGKWGLKEEELGKGLKFGTYRSTCNRGGERTKSEKSFSFNEAILEPYLQQIANHWEKAFSRSIPCSLDRFTTTFTQTLGKFHSMMSARPELQKCRMSSMRIFSQQMDIHSKSIEATIQLMKADIQHEQRQASREFVPEIKEEMMSVYERCANEKGPGSFMRMKDHMMKHVTKQKSVMYRKASKRVLKKFIKVFESNRKELTDSAHTIVDGLQKDFEMILGNSEMLEASEVAREHIRGILQGVDVRFGSILCNEPMEVDQAQSPQFELQQLPDMSIVDLDTAPGEAGEAASSGEDVAMDTAL